MQIVNVMAATLDGAIAAHADEADTARAASGFTPPDDRDHLLGLVRTADAVVVGARSLIASGAAFEERNAHGRLPLWVVLSNRGLPPELPFWRQAAVPRLLVSQKPLSMPVSSPNLENLVVGPGSAPRFVVEALKARGCERVLLFGGAEVNRQFYAEGLVDQLWLTVCPLILASSAALPLVRPELPRPVHLRLLTSQSRGDLVFLNYQVKNV